MARKKNKSQLSMVRTGRTQSKKPNQANGPAAGPVGSDYWSDPRVRAGVRAALEQRQYTRPLAMDLTRFIKDEA